MILTTAQAFKSVQDTPEEFNGIYYVAYQLYHAH